MREFFNNHGSKIALAFSFFGSIVVFDVIKSASGNVSKGAIAFAIAWTGLHVFAACLIYYENTTK